MAEPESRQWISIGRIVRPHGIRGEVRLKLHNPDSDVLSPGMQVRLCRDSGQIRHARIEAVRFVPNGFVLLMLEDVRSRDAAESLRNVELEVDREVLGELEDGEFYIVDVIGARVEIEGDEQGRVGKVVDYLNYPSTDVLVIDFGGARYEVPLLDDFVVSVVTTGSSKVVVRNIDGFIVGK